MVTIELPGFSYFSLLIVLILTHRIKRGNKLRYMLDKKLNTDATLNIFIGILKFNLIIK